MKLVVQSGSVLTKYIDHTGRGVVVECMALKFCRERPMRFKPRSHHYRNRYWFFFQLTCCDMNKMKLQSHYVLKSIKHTDKESHIT